MVGELEGKGGLTRDGPTYGASVADGGIVIAEQAG